MTALARLRAVPEKHNTGYLMLVFHMRILGPTLQLQRCFCLWTNKKNIYPVLGTCATFSATAPLARTEKGGARRGGAKVKDNVIIIIIINRLFFLTLRTGYSMCYMRYCIIDS